MIIYVIYIVEILQKFWFVFIIYIKTFMLIRRCINVRSSIYLFSKLMNDQNFRVYNNMIMKAKDIEDIKEILISHHKSFNQINLSAILQKMNQFHYTSNNKQDFNDIIQIVTNAIKNKWPSQYVQQNAHTLSNIICYLSNLEVYSLNPLIQKLDVSKLLELTTNKQKVMMLSGLIRLGVKQQYFKNANLFIKDLQKHYSYLKDKDRIVSIWRNLIDRNLNSAQSDIFFANSLKNDNKPWNRLISYTFYLYCFTKCGRELPQFCKKQLLNFKFEDDKIKIKINEFTIFCNNLSQIKHLYDQQNLKKLKQIIQISFYRYLGFKQLNARGLSNLYQSLKLLNYDDQNASNAIRIKFLKKITSQTSMDLLSFSYLFEKLIIFNPSDQELYNACIQYLKNIKLQQASNNIIFTIIIAMYNFHKLQRDYKADFPIINSIQKQLLTKTFKKQQYRHLLTLLKVLPTFSPEICQKIKAELTQQKTDEKQLKWKCILGKQNKGCLNCFQNMC